ncbi:formamidopyrimidine-DNA glycosylase [Luminiphilus syltensis NOR5-1B]|uniref:Formamidopyrimidine-DNA glycosylase n=1 Tax=Luminiphilus syltensis NOR5-1B TaxID=565045 RepID=B8KU92_9GAMM|nr:bifunctional DNA-formamidopyrimidine glycosylase/DNA-(apurinic or apyrimidinic site) lyase [Luminiphilus syltensis]EED36594.1 formamidopyrimidine-DNA glycosylase [Luminiphilus syltensis NOR5-1B]
MPELPEVETTRRGIAPHVIGQSVVAVDVRDSRLRWPVPDDLDRLVGGRFTAVRRRAKYLLLDHDHGVLMIHLGMSGSLRLVSADTPVMFHDHVDIGLSSGLTLRYHDPRRFGSFHWVDDDHHALLDHLGPEPLSGDFDGALLYRRSRGRKTAVKQFVMDGRIVVGVGNIYANEALFMAGIRPDRAAGRVALKRYETLGDAIKQVLGGAIEQGGTTLRDFVGGDGSPGYFAQQLAVYGRARQPCRRCESALTETRLGGRSTVFCKTCQR